MADQTVKLVGDSGSPQRVALELMEKVIYYDKNGRPTTKQEVIDLYVDCLYAMYQNRNGGK